MTAAEVAQYFEVNARQHLERSLGASFCMFDGFKLEIV